jgi:hypothetical protein
MAYCSTLKNGADKFFQNAGTSPNYNELTVWNRVFLEKLPITQLLKNFRKLAGTRKFITVFTRAPNGQMNPVHNTLSYL